MRWRARALMLLACLFSAMVPVLSAWAERGDITEFDLPEGSHMRAMVAGPDGNLWLAGGFSGCNRYCVPAAVIRLTPDGKATPFRLPPGSGETPVAITLGPDGNLWVVEFDLSRVLRVTTEGEFTVYSLGGEPTSIASGPDGNLWVTEPISPYRRITRLTVDGDVTRFPLPPGLSAGGIIAGPDDRMWFLGRGRRIGTISMDGTIEELDIPVEPVSNIALGSDGNVWFAAFANGPLIARLTPKGDVTEFPIPHRVGTIAAGPDGALWGTESAPLTGVQHIVRITTQGESEEFAVPPPPRFLGAVAAGPDGNIWYTASDPSRRQRVGRLEVDGATAGVPSVRRSGR